MADAAGAVRAAAWSGLRGEATPPLEPPFVCADSRKLTAATRWRPTYSLDEGLRHTVEWWRHELATRG